MVRILAFGLLMTAPQGALPAWRQAVSPPGRGQVERRPSDPQLPSPPGPAQTVTGKVSGIIRRARPGPVQAMVDVILTASNGQKELVRLAPIGFLEQKKFVVREGDVLTVSGYRMTAGEGKLFVAIEARRDGQTLRLRHSPGRPVWKEGAQ